jgi:hypothetical protein
MSENLELYNKVREVPKSAQKVISAGRLKGYIDINPMWRIKVLTEQFGMCGVGWKYEITDTTFKDCGNEEILVFVSINLYVKVDGKWSDAIPGNGGSKLVTKENSGKLYNNDEAIKMSVTDSIGAACKVLGVGANIYWDKDESKYAELKTPETKKKTETKPETKKETKKETKNETKNEIPDNQDPNEPSQEQEDKKAADLKRGIAAINKKVTELRAKKIDDKIIAKIIKDIYGKPNYMGIKDVDMAVKVYNGLKDYKVEAAPAAEKESK